MNIDHPYLSVVAASRNDDHGKNLHRRMQIFVNGFFEQCHRFQLPAELIMVDWNPPSGKPSLADALAWPVQDAFCSARIIQVPSEIHNRFKHSEALPLFQMIAKNVGIRRSKGKFILATNIDILLNDALIQYIAERRLRRGIMYRINRYDVAEDVPLNATIQEQLAYCDQNLIRVNVKGLTIPIDGKLNYVYKPLSAERIVGVMPVRLQRLYYSTYEGIFHERKRARLRQSVQTVEADNLSQNPTQTAIRSLYTRMPVSVTRRVPNSWKPLLKLFIKDIGAWLKIARANVALVKRPLRSLYNMAEFPHLNACGDFTLLAREHWFEVQGYPEDAIFSMHLDSLFCCAVWLNGIHEKILYEPMRAYHIEHATGSGYTAEGWNALVQRLEKAGIPQLSYEALVEKVDQMRHRRITKFNDDQWGLSCEDFEEKVVSNVQSE